MNQIHVLDPRTIDKIAAGEVVERPASVVKELLENAIDAGATRITIEIRDGGISLIRITDNGKGISREDIPLAFMRHATSKITEVGDLLTLQSLGFRGEALSSIAAVSRVELITKQADSLSAVRYLIEGGREKLMEDIGAPDGTTIAVRNLFYNTPARAKFLKTPMTEASHVGAVVEQLLLSHPEVAFTFVVNGQQKVASSGSGELKNAVYTIYGREVMHSLLPLYFEEEGIRIEGFIGKPALSRGNRSYENYYVNGRYLKSRVIGRGIEDGYGTMLMNHQYPFTCFKMEIDAGTVDVNVHPTKMDVRFSDEKRVYEAVRKAVHETLAHQEMVVAATLNPVEKKKDEKADRTKPLQAFETKAAAADAGRQTSGSAADEPGRQAAVPSNMAAGNTGSGSLQSGSGQSVAGQSSGSIPGFGMFENSRPTGAAPAGNTAAGSAAGLAGNMPSGSDRSAAPTLNSASAYAAPAQGDLLREAGHVSGDVKKTEAETLFPKEGRYEQQSFIPSFLSREAAPLRRIVGQVFDTYWICEFDGKMYLFDQHAAHEKVLFERLMKLYENRELTSQQLSPPLVVTLSAREETLLSTYKDAFADLGFEVEEFGERDYCIRAVPYTLGGIDSGDLFRQLLDQLEVSGSLSDLHTYVRKIATEACKAAVKGGEHISTAEAQQLLTDLMDCEDPYHCPHGRPTIISFTRQDLEKRFKRII
ncbi:MAG: DNA mismatch repair endonuclease MutL [Lachnospiraceae bacterium]|nr:DNA mismatch repair endonuclease MutL [Lachnospiraceae bacterium]